MFISSIFHCEFVLTSSNIVYAFVMILRWVLNIPYWYLHAVKPEDVIGEALSIIQYIITNFSKKKYF